MTKTVVLFISTIATAAIAAAAGLARAQTAPPKTSGPLTVASPGGAWAARIVPR